MDPVDEYIPQITSANLNYTDPTDVPGATFSKVSQGIDPDGSRTSLTPTSQVGGSTVSFTLSDELISVKDSAIVADIVITRPNATDDNYSYFRDARQLFNNVTITFGGNNYVINNYDSWSLVEGQQPERNYVNSSAANYQFTEEQRAEKFPKWNIAGAPWVSDKHTIKVRIPLFAIAPLFQNMKILPLAFTSKGMKITLSANALDRVFSNSANQVTQLTTFDIQNIHLDKCVLSAKNELAKNWEKSMKIKMATEGINFKIGLVDSVETSYAGSTLKIKTDLNVEARSLTRIEYVIKQDIGSFYNTWKYDTNVEAALQGGKENNILAVPRLASALMYFHSTMAIPNNGYPITDINMAREYWLLSRDLIGHFFTGSACTSNDYNADTFILGFDTRPEGLRRLKDNLYTGLDTRNIPGTPHLQLEFSSIMPQPFTLYRFATTEGIMRIKSRSASMPAF